MVPGIDDRVWNETLLAKNRKRLPVRDVAVRLLVHPVLLHAVRSFLSQDRSECVSIKNFRSFDEELAEDDGNRALPTNPVLHP